MEETHMEDETADGTPLIQVYIENAKDASIGGFSIPLPITKEVLEPWLSAIETDEGGGNIAIRNLHSSVPELEVMLREAVPVDGAGDALDELNYLAAKLAGLDEFDRDVFEAAVEAGSHGKGAAELINLTENLDRFDLFPILDDERYADFCIERAQGECAKVRVRLAESDDAKDRALAAYIEKLERHVDRRAYGHDAIAEDHGVITGKGLLLFGDGFEEVYRGPGDIPWEFRLFDGAAPRLLKTSDVELVPFLAKLHAVAGEYPRDAVYNLKTLAALRESEYLLLLDGRSAYLIEATHAYRRGTAAFDIWTGALETPDTKALAIHVTEANGRIVGDVEELDLTERQRDIISHSIRPIAVEATLRDGETFEYAPAEWEGIPPSERDRAVSWQRMFRTGDCSEVHQHLAEIGDVPGSVRTVGADELLVGINAAYMERSSCAATGFLRVSQDTAKEILARGEVEVFRLLPEGAAKLEQIDAVKSGLWFSEHREFAIRQKDLPKLDGWAHRSAKAVLDRTARRDRQERSHGEEL
jgi:hypothetical protein